MAVSMKDTIAEAFPATTARKSIDKITVKDLVEATRAFFSAATEHYGLLQKLLNSQKRVQVERMLLQGVRTYLQELSRYQPSKRALSYADAEIELNFCAWGFTGLLPETPSS